MRTEKHQHIVNVHYDPQSFNQRASRFSSDLTEARQETLGKEDRVGSNEASTRLNTKENDHFKVHCSFLN